MSEHHFPLLTIDSQLDLGVDFDWIIQTDENALIYFTPLLILLYG